MSPYPGNRTMALVLLPEGEKMPDTAPGALPPGTLWTEVAVHPEMLEPSTRSAFEAFALPLARRLAREYERTQKAPDAKDD